jgi:hypothetical protein
MNRLLIAAIAASTLVSSTAMAQSSKFAATYDTDPVMVKVTAGVGESLCGVFDGITHCARVGGPVAEMDLAQLHVAQWKEILGEVSAQVQLTTFTKVKGKNEGGTTTAIAEGTMRAGMIVAAEGDAPDCSLAFGLYDEGTNVFAAPGPVTFASRAQELSVSVDLDVVGSIPEVCDAQCIEDNLGIEGDVTVALGLDTTAASSFQFIADDLDSGDYDVIACYDLSAFAYVSGVDLDADSVAYSKVVLGPRIITAQEVRATKTGVIDETGTD